MIDPSNLPGAEQFDDPSAYIDGLSVDWRALLETAVLGSFLAYVYALIYGIGRVTEEIGLLVYGLLRAPVLLAEALLQAFTASMATAADSAAASLAWLGPVAWLASIVMVLATVLTIVWVVTYVR